MKLGLDQIRNLVARLGHPQKDFPSIHIAGTNGKGSTAAIIESILRESGYKSGLYTSPHLIDMRERIKLRGEEITEEEVVHYIEYMRLPIEATGASFFEILTAMAFLFFSDKKTDIAILETGLGGRLDATNIVHPLITIITDIGLDHTKILGKSLKHIAGEKAGILKPGIPCITGIKNKKVMNFFRAITLNKNISMIFSQDRVTVKNIRLSERETLFNIDTGFSKYEDIELRLLGEHQVENCVTAILAIEELIIRGWNIPEEAVRSGIKKVTWRARLDLLQDNPKVLLDSAHNPLGMKRLTHALKHLFDYDKLILIYGVLKDKDYKRMTNQIGPLVDRVILTRPLSDRALEPDKLRKLLVFKNKTVDVIPDIQKAWEKAINISEKSDLICGAGSIYFVGELLRLWKMNCEARATKKRVTFGRN
jgi:dihydrofolate synthase/folylpolyglutamate synthase